MKSLILRLLLLLAVYECNTQLMLYDEHYYAFYHLQANLTFAILTCQGAVGRSDADDLTTVGRSYPVVLNDQQEQAAILRFYRENSRIQNSFVWIGGRVRVDEDRRTECEDSPYKPPGYDCSDLMLMDLTDGSFSNYTSWDADTDIDDFSDAVGAAWGKQSNTWLPVTDGDDPRVKELICEFSSVCVHPDIHCRAGGVCLRRTAYTNYTCVCQAGFHGTSCEIDDLATATDQSATAAASESDSGTNSAVVNGVVGGICALLFVGGLVACVGKKRGGYPAAAAAPPADVGYRASVGSAVSGASAAPAAAPSGVSAASGGSVVW